MDIDMARFKKTVEKKDVTPVVNRIDKVAGADVTTTNAMQVENIAFKDLRKSEFDKFSKDRVEDMAESIKENGLKEPLSVYERNGKYYILSGNTRYMAISTLIEESEEYKKMFKFIPCIVDTDYKFENEVDEKFHLALHNQNRTKTNEDRLLEFNTYKEYYEYHKEDFKNEKITLYQFISLNMGIKSEMVRRLNVIATKLIDSLIELVKQEELNLKTACDIGVREIKEQEEIFNIAKDMFTKNEMKGGEEKTLGSFVKKAFLKIKEEEKLSLEKEESIIADEDNDSIDVEDIKDIEENSNVDLQSTSFDENDEKGEEEQNIFDDTLENDQSLREENFLDEATGREEETTFEVTFSKAELEDLVPSVILNRGEKGVSNYILRCLEEKKNTI